MTKPIVSVLIDTYNHERYIEQAVVSAIEQDFPADEYEILVVDDGSTDRTPEIVQKFAPRVRLLRKKNGGQASAFNSGIAEASGEVISFLDGDDWFAPGKLTTVMDTLEQQPEAVAVGHGHYDFYEQTNEVKTCVPPQRRFVRLTTPRKVGDVLSNWPFLLMGALTMRKRRLDRLMPIPESIQFCADTPIFMAAMAEGAIVLDQPLFYYRHHSTNLHAPDDEDPTKMRRSLDMKELMLRLTLPKLINMGVRPDSARALVCPSWTQVSRQNLATFGGSRLRTLRTEMRAFSWEYHNPSFAHSLFKYLVVGAAALLLPARRFYKMRDWYMRKNLGRLRERLLGGG